MSSKQDCVQEPNEEFSLSLDFVMNPPTQAPVSEDVHKNLKHLFIAFLKQKQKTEQYQEGLVTIIKERRNSAMPILQDCKVSEKPNRLLSMISEIYEDVQNNSTKDSIGVESVRNNLNNSMDKGNYEQLYEDNVRLQHEVEKLSNDLSDSHDRVDRLIKETHNIEHRFEEMELQMMKKTQKMEEQLRLNNRKNQDKDEELRYLEKDLQKFKHLYLETLTQLQNANEVCSKLPQLESQVATLKQQNEFYKSEVDMYKMQKDSYDKNLKAGKSEQQVLRLRTQVLKAQLKCLKTDSKKEVSNLKAIVETLEIQNFDIKNELEELNQKSMNLSIAAERRSIEKSKFNAAHPINLEDLEMEFLSYESNVLDSSNFGMTDIMNNSKILQQEKSHNTTQSQRNINVQDLKKNPLKKKFSYFKSDLKHMLFDKEEDHIKDLDDSIELEEGVDLEKLKMGEIIEALSQETMDLQQKLMISNGNISRLQQELNQLQEDILTESLVVDPVSMEASYNKLMKKYVRHIESSSEQMNMLFQEIEILQKVKNR